MKALSIRQPWAWGITHSTKRIENRTWKTDFRGEFLIHAAAKFDGLDSLFRVQAIAREMVREHQMPRGAIVGGATLVGCTEYDSFLYPFPWMYGPWLFVLRDVWRCEPVECKGRLGFFSVRPEIVEQAVRTRLNVAVDE